MHREYFLGNHFAIVFRQGLYRLITPLPESRLSAFTPEYLFVFVCVFVDLML
jgi:hypothetical protein